MTKLSTIFGVIFAVTLTSQVGLAKTAGLLVVGTQTEVKHILAGTGVTPVFSEENPSAMVAVRLTKDTMTIYERECVNDILKFIGKVVEGGVAITLKVGCELCNLLNDLGGTVIKVGEAALKAACKILCELKCLVLEGVNFTVQTVTQVLKCAAELLKCLIGGC